MKIATHSFSKPIQVIQIFRKQIRFGKEEKKTFDLRAFHSAEEATSNLGFVEDGKLFLPENVKEAKGFAEADLLVLVENIISEKPAECHFLRTTSLNSVEIFKIRGIDAMELHLVWNYFDVGEPKRPDIKLCDLTPSKAYEIRLNGKTDFSLTGRRPRHYLEQVFSVEHLGAFTQCHWIADSEVRPTKTRPLTRKLIDLRKPLW